MKLYVSGELQTNALNTFQIFVNPLYNSSTLSFPKIIHALCFSANINWSWEWRWQNVEKVQSWRHQYYIYPVVA